MLSRKQFAAMYNKIRPGLGISSSNLWIPEHTTKIKSSWFVSIQPLSGPNEWISAMRISTKEVYWAWVAENCAGQVRCYSCDYENGIEWWGFEKESDIAFWFLKWA